MSSIDSLGACDLQSLYFAMEQMEDEAHAAARTVRRAAQESQVHALRQQADHIEAGAGWRGASEVVAGACQMGGASLQLNALGASESAATEAARSATTQRGAAGNQALSALGQIAKGCLDRAADIEGADAQRAAARATASAMRADDAKEVEDALGSARERILRNLETTEQIERDVAATLLRA